MSGIDDLREAYPKWSEEELQQCRERYENLPKTDESVSFDEFAGDRETIPAVAP